MYSLDVCIEKYSLKIYLQRPLPKQPLEDFSKEDSFEKNSIYIVCISVHLPIFYYSQRANCYLTTH